MILVSEIQKFVKIDRFLKKLRYLYLFISQTKSLSENADIQYSILGTWYVVLNTYALNVASMTPGFPRFFSRAILHPVS